VPAATAEAAKAPAKPPDPPPAVAPSATATAEAAPAEVEITVDATPKAVVVEVYRDGEKIGSSDKPVRLKREDGKVKLTFKAAGYASQDKEVPASASSTVAVTLKKPGSGKKSDLEF
jgi:hypothetical protein